MAESLIIKTPESQKIPQKGVGKAPALSTNSPQSTFKKSLQGQNPLLSATRFSPPELKTDLGSTNQERKLSAKLQHQFISAIGGADTLPSKIDNNKKDAKSSSSVSASPKFAAKEKPKEKTPDNISASRADPVVNPTKTAEPKNTTPAEKPKNPNDIAASGLKPTDLETLDLSSKVALKYTPPVSKIPLSPEIQMSSLIEALAPKKGPDLAQNPPQATEGFLSQEQAQSLGIKPINKAPEINTFELLPTQGNVAPKNIPSEKLSSKEGETMKGLLSSGPILLAKGIPPLPSGNAQGQQNQGFSQNPSFGMAQQTKAQEIKLESTNGPGQTFGKTLEMGGKAPQVLSKHVMKQVAVDLKSAAQKGVEKLEIKLSPASLGTVKVEMKLTEEKTLSVLVSAENQDTLNLLQRDASDLQAALEEAGFSTSQDSLHFSFGDNEKKDFQNLTSDTRYPSEITSGEDPQVVMAQTIRNPDLLVDLVA